MTGGPWSSTPTAPGPAAPSARRAQTDGGTLVDCSTPASGTPVMDRTTTPIPTDRRLDCRVVDLVVISDVHLGNRACRANDLLNYLGTVQPKELILNGDIIDMWEYRNGYWPKDHTRVLRRILAFANAGVPVFYVTGNHDAALRNFSQQRFGNIRLVDGLARVINGKRHWFLHGDLLDAELATPAWLAWLGEKGYDSALWLDKRVNRVRNWMGLKRVRLAKALKYAAPGARRHINTFENACAALAADGDFDAIVTGHIHHANNRTIDVNGRPVHYLNSGDWTESLTALECHAGTWSVVKAEDLPQPVAAGPGLQHDDVELPSLADFQGAGAFA